MRNLEPDKARLHQISGKSYTMLNSPLTSIGSPSLLGQASEFRTSLRIAVYDALLSARETEFEEIGERAVLRSAAVHPTGLLAWDYFRLARDPFTIECERQLSFRRDGRIAWDYGVGNMPHLPRICRRRHEADLGWWELTVGQPHPALRSYVREYIGGVEHTTVPIYRREIPTDITPVVFNFGARSRFFDSNDPTRWTDCGSFATGPHDSYVVVGSTGPLNCLQVNFTVLGARLFLGQPLRELANRAVAIEDVVGPAGLRLTMELYDARTWEQRFVILNREIMRRISTVRQLAPPVLWTWQRLVKSDGGLKIGTVVRDVGWSQKHLIAQFTEQMGLTPKVLARVLRFGRAIKLLKVGPRVPLADIAYACGYYDQAHFSRDFRAFAGVTPTELVRQQLPAGGGFSADR